MGIESLIPFGLQAEGEQLVDVGNVRRGNACGCICPSCRTPLVARQGDEKAWHFAHRSLNVHNETKNECKYSFAFSVRLMIRQLSNDGLKFKLPRYECSLPAFSEHSCRSKTFSYLVAKESVLTLDNVQVGVNFSGVPVDILGLVEGFPFVVFVTYKERSLPSELKNPDERKCGIVEFNVNAVPRLLEGAHRGQYKEALRRYIEDATDGKTWAYHPREQKRREAALAKRRSWLLQQEREASDFAIRNRSCQAQVNPRAGNRHRRSYVPAVPAVRNYKCVMCASAWTGVSPVCKTCNTHLYTWTRSSPDV